MKLTKERKALLAVMAFGLGALAFDRAILRPAPAEAVAETPAEIVRPIPARTVAAVTGTPPRAKSRGNPLSARLEKLAKSRNLSAQPVGDAFRLSSQWGGSTDTGERKEVAASVQFRASHRLTGTLVGTRRQAIVNGKLVVVGEAIDGFTLIEVGNGDAVFASTTERVTLQIDRPQVPAAMDR